MKHLLTIGSIIGMATSVLHSQSLQNGDFSKGKAGWQGDGAIVFLDPSGKIEPKESPTTERVLKITLKKGSWSSVKQSLHPLAKDTAVDASFEVRALPDFKPVLESRDYTKVDFKEGGSYVWSAEVWPKCDLLVRVQDATWYYRPRALKPLDTWKIFHVNFPNLASRNRSFTIALPPGEGSVLIKNIK